MESKEGSVGGDISLISDGICSTVSNSYGSVGSNQSSSYG